MIEELQNSTGWNFLFSLASAFGFVISVWVLFQTYRLKNQAEDIKQSIINKARVPQLHFKLSASSRKLSKLKSLDDKEPISECVTEIRVLADKLLAKVDESEREGVSRLIFISDEYITAPSHKKYDHLANNIYIQLKKVIFSMEEYLQDEKLR